MRVHGAGEGAVAVCERHEEVVVARPDVQSVRLERDLVGKFRLFRIGSTEYQSEYQNTRQSWSFQISLSIECAGKKIEKHLRKTNSKLCEFLNRYDSL